jgi:hypothetical protein
MAKHSSLVAHLEMGYLEQAILLFMYNRVPTGGIILYFITSCVLIAASAISSESFQAASSLNFMLTFMQSLLIGKSHSILITSLANFILDSDSQS